jgi:hypothetical protein
MTAMAPDYDQIVRVVPLCVDGFNDCDISKFRGVCFHEDAWIFCTGPDSQRLRGSACSGNALRQAARCASERICSPDTAAIGHPAAQARSARSSRRSGASTHRCATGHAAYR